MDGWLVGRCGVSAVAVTAVAVSAVAVTAVPVAAVAVTAVAVTAALSGLYATAEFQNANPTTQLPNHEGAVPGRCTTRSHTTHQP